MAEVLKFRHPSAQPDADAVRRLCGNVTDRQVAEILGTGAGLDDIEVAVGWASGEDDVMGKERRPLSGGAVAVYDILVAEDVDWDDDRPA